MNKRREKVDLKVAQSLQYAAEDEAARLRRGLEELREKIGELLNPQRGG